MSGAARLAKVVIEERGMVRVDVETIHLLLPIVLFAGGEEIAHH